MPLPDIACCSDAQNGQAAVGILAFLGIVILCFIFLFQSGRLTTEKMQLQNAADAAAFSACTLEARAMNFSAYLNRAMVANEVAIGQMVGMLSWSDELVCSGEELEAIGTILDGTLVLAEIGAAFNTIGGIFIDVGSVMKDALDAVVPVGIKAVSGLNRAYSDAEEIYHKATIALQAAVIVRNIRDNVPGTDTDNNENILEELLNPGHKGARLSPFGLIAFAGHIPSYLSGYSKRYTPEKHKDRTAMGRMAATIREARDDFSSGRRCPSEDDPDYDPNCVAHNRDWAIGLKVNIDLLLLKISLSATANSRGGSEIRYKDNHFIWSAVDTAVMEGGISFSDTKKKKKKKKKKESGSKSLDAPLGGGSSQANGADVPLELLDMPFGMGKHGTPKAYGRAADSAGRSIPWYEAASRIGENEVPDSPYPNLRPYRDVAIKKKKEVRKGREEMKLPFQAPYFLVGVVRDTTDIRENGPNFSPPFRLEEGETFNGRMAALARAEVYFSRPDDLSYFRRKDRYIEKPSLFSPFWQPRLVRTTAIDRMLALWFQQKIIWLDIWKPDGSLSPKKAFAELREIWKEIW